MELLQAPAHPVPLPERCCSGSCLLSAVARRAGQLCGISSMPGMSLGQARGPLSLPLVDLHHLLGQCSQEVGLVHFQGADIQHRQVCLQLLQQEAAASIPELWGDKVRGCGVLPSHPLQSSSAREKTFLELLTGPCSTFTSHSDCL